MNTQTIINLQKTREEIWDIQETIQKKESNISVSEIHRMLGELANNIIRYQSVELENSNSQDELFAKLDSLVENSREEIPFFIDLKNNLLLFSKGEVIDSNNEYEKNIENFARELLAKFIM